MILRSLVGREGLEQTEEEEPRVDGSSLPVPRGDYDGEGASFPLPTLCQVMKNPWGVPGLRPPLWKLWRPLLPQAAGGGL